METGCHILVGTVQLKEELSWLTTAETLKNKEDQLEKPTNTKVPIQLKFLQIRKKRSLLILLVPSRENLKNDRVTMNC